MATRDEKLRFLIEAKGDEVVTKLAREVEKLAKSGDAAEEDISGFVEELDRLAKIDRSISALTRLKAGLAETGTNLDKARQRVAELEREFDKAEAPTAKLRKELDRSRAAVAELVKEQNRQRAAIDANSGSLKKAGVDTERLGSAQRQVRQDITALTDRFGTYTKQLREAGTGAERAAEGTRKLGASAKATGAELQQVQIGLGKVAAAAGAALAAIKSIQFGGNLVGEAAALEQSLAQVQAVSGATAADLGKLRDAAERASEDTGIAIGAVTDGLAELARTGLDADGVIAALKPSLDLAQAGNIALAQAVEIATTTLTQFGLGADEAGRVADVLAQTANSTQSSVEGLGRSLTDVAPLARQLGIPLEETVAILGRLSDEGFKGSRAGTSLRAAFTQLLDPSTKFREELAKLGITSTDFTTVLEELATKGDAGRNAILALGQEAAPAILALAGKGGQAIRSLTEELQASAGAAELVAAKVRDTLGNAFERLSNTAGNAINNLIDPLLKPLQGLLEDVAERLRAFADSADFTKIKEGLAEAFTQGVELIRDLVESADFSALSQQVQEFTDDAGTRFRGLRGDVTSIVAALEAIAATLRVVFNGIRAELAGFNRDLAGFKRLAKEAQLALLEYSSIFRENAEFRAKVQAEINELIAEEARLSAERKQAYQDLEQASDDFGDAIGRIGQKVEEVGKKGSLLEGIGAALKAALEGLKDVSQGAGAAEADIGNLGLAVSEAAGEIEKGNQRAAKSFDLTIDASNRVKLAIIANFEQVRAELEQKANDIALNIARGLESGSDTSALQAELQQVQNQLTDTDRKLQQARASMGSLADSTNNAAQSFRGLSGAAANATGALRSVEQAASEAFGNISGQTTQVVGGPLQGLNKAFEEARNRAKALGDEALRAFDATLRVGDQFTGTGFSISQTMDLLARRTQAAIDTASELERTYARSRDIVRETAEAAAELSRIQSLSLEQQRQANLEAEQELLQVSQERANAQAATAGAIERQVSATRELNGVRASSPPERIELFAVNQQKPGELLSEISERDLDRLMQLLLSRIQTNGRGVFGR